MKHYPRYPLDVNVQDWSQWPYVAQTGRPNIAQHWPRSYPTIQQSAAYQVYGPPPRPKIVNHTMHLFLSLITVGFWIPVWFTVMIITHTANTRADAEYWSRIQKYWQWELAQQSAAIPPPREMHQGG